MAKQVAYPGASFRTTCDLDGLSTRIQHPGQTVVYRGNSPYGRLIVTESSGQYNFIHNGVALFSAQAAGGSESLRYTDKDVEMEYYIIYTNAGSGDATNVIVTDTAPAEFQYLTSNGAWDGSMVTWSIGVVPAGTRATLTLRVRVPAYAGRGAYMITATPRRQMSAPRTS